MKNKYVRRSKISEDKFRKIIRYFSLELDSHKIASLTCLNRNTIIRYLNRIRERLYLVCARQSPFVSHAITLDDEAVGTAPIFGLKEDGARVHTDIIPAASAVRLRRCLRAEDGASALPLPERWACYDGIIDMDRKRLFGPAASTTDSTGGSTRGRVIEAFIGFSRKRMLHRHLADTDHFGLRLKECEFRFNHREKDLYQLMLKMFRESPLT